MKETRNYGIDLLRLVLMFMVCVLHVLGKGGVLAAARSVDHSVYWFMQVFSFCAVNAFAFISGYTAKNKPQKYSKIVDMWFQVWFYSFILSILLTIVGYDGDWGLKEIVLRFLPVASGEFWYFTAYFVLFFAMPMINPYLFDLDESKSRKVFIILFVMFSVLGLLRDAFCTGYGYSPLWVIVLYCMGVLARKINLFSKWPTPMLCLLLFLCTCITWGEYELLGTTELFIYISPAVLLSGICLVIIFSRFSPKGTIIKYLSPLAFGIYLFQVSPVVWEEIINDAFAVAASKPIVIGVLYVLMFAFCIFVSGLIVEFLRSKLAQILGVHRLSEKIVQVFDRTLTALGVILR